MQIKQTVKTIVNSHFNLLLTPWSAADENKQSQKRLAKSSQYLWLYFVHWQYAEIWIYITSHLFRMWATPCTSLLKHMELIWYDIYFSYPKQKINNFFSRWTLNHRMINTHFNHILLVTSKTFYINVAHICLIKKEDNNKMNSWLSQMEY